MRKPTIWVPTRSDTNRAVQSQKMVRGWKFWIYKVEELYYQCSENKGADHLCFCLCRLLVFPCDGSINIFFFVHIILYPNQKVCNAKKHSLIPMHHLTMINQRTIGPENAHLKPDPAVLSHHEMTLTLNTHTPLLNS